MIDRRADILDRIEAILIQAIADVDGVLEPNVFRNRGDVPTELRPAMVLLDGLENTVLTKPSPRGGPSSSIMAMRPEIYALLRRRDLLNTDEYGPELAQYRNSILTRILYDGPLLSLLGNNGGIVYNGFETDMQSGSFMRGELLMKFTFHYPLIPSDLL